MRPAAQWGAVGCGGVVVNTQLTMHILTYPPSIIKQEGRDEGFRGSVRTAASGF